MRVPQESDSADFRLLVKAREALAQADVGALEFLAANPGVSPATLAKRLNHGATAIGLVMAIYGAASEKNELRATAKKLLVGEILDAFPDGWPYNAKLHPLVRLNWSAHIKRRVSAPCVAKYSSRIVLELTMKSPPPRGWKPALVNDPIIDELFDRFWPAGIVRAAMDVEQYQKFWERRGVSRRHVFKYVAGTGIRQALRESGLWENLLSERVARAEFALQRPLQNGDVNDMAGELLNDILDPYGDNDEEAQRTRFIESAPMASAVEEWLLQQSRRAIAFSGHGGLDLLGVYPALSLSELALVLNRGTTGLGLVMEIYRDAEARDQVRAAAKDLLIRRILRAYPEGWTLTGSAPALRLASWSFYINRYVCDSRIDKFASQIESDLAARTQPPEGWVPTQRDDPFINKLFDRWWPVV